MWRGRGPESVRGTLADDQVTVAGELDALSLTMSAAAATITHSGGTGLTISSSSSYVDVESVRFTGAEIGLSTDSDLVTLADDQVTVAGDLDALSLTMSAAAATITHSGGTGLTISSSRSYVDVASVRFPGAEIGLSTDSVLVRLAEAPGS